MVATPLYLCVPNTTTVKNSKFCQNHWHPISLQPKNSPTLFCFFENFDLGKVAGLGEVKDFFSAKTSFNTSQTSFFGRKASLSDQSVTFYSSKNQAFINYSMLFRQFWLRSNPYKNFCPEIFLKSWSRSFFAESFLVRKISELFKALKP